MNLKSTPVQNETIMLDWSKIDTVFLDMDGTLLDLHFDNHFWLEHLPKRYAEEKQVSAATAELMVSQHCRDIAGSLDWYCLDYWQNHLELDLVTLKREIADRIAVREHVEDFLGFLQQQDKQIVLLTNAHQKSVDLKFEHVHIESFFDEIITSHALGLAKEHPEFWPRLNEIKKIDKQRSLFIDDNLQVLANARAYGLVNLLAIYLPDSRGEPKDTGEFTAIKSYQQLMPAGYPEKHPG
ncbi:MAG: GMP/IMP nucleotidase [Thiolinea sp.]